MLESQVVLHSFLLGGNQSLFVRLWAPSWFLSISAVDWSVPWSGYWFCVRCTIQAHVFAGWLVYSQIFRNREGIQPVRHETMDRLCQIRVSACFSIFCCVVSFPKNGKQWSALMVTVTILWSESSGLLQDSLCWISLQHHKGRNGYWQGSFTHNSWGTLLQVNSMTMLE